MAKNDKVLLDGIIDDRIQNNMPSSDRGEVFELLAAEQFLKDFDLTTDEILGCNVDGRNDGGIDFAFIFINGHLLTDPNEFIFPKSNAELSITLMSCKHADSFKLAPLDTMLASLSELFDFSIQTDNLKAQYNDDVIIFRERVLRSYRKIASVISTFSISIVYACRGNSSELADNIIARGNQLEATILQRFSACEVQTIYLGCSELLDLFRKQRKMDFSLRVAKYFSSGENYIVLMKLKDYYEFICDECGALRYYLFDSNVRDFLGQNRVNVDIIENLSSKSASDFWLYNNGVTLIASSARAVGDTVDISNVQIVNGLQTTHSIFNYFLSGGTDPEQRCLLARIIVTSDEVLRDAIIRATNNQSNIELSSLSATDRIQRNIEDVLLRNGWYYARKKNYYENQGIPSQQIIQPLSIATGFVSFVLKLPYASVLLTNRFMTIPEEYELVFNNDTDLLVWPKICSILRKADAFLDTKSSELSLYKKGRKALRTIIPFFAISNFYGTFAFSFKDLIEFNTEELSELNLQTIYDQIFPMCDPGKESFGLGSRNFLLRICDLFPCISNREVLRDSQNLFAYHGGKLDDTLLNMVNDYIQVYGWHKQLVNGIAQKLDCSYYVASQALNYLILVKRLIPPKHTNAI